MNSIQYLDNGMSRCCVAKPQLGYLGACRAQVTYQTCTYTWGGPILLLQAVSWQLTVCNTVCL